MVSSSDPRVGTASGADIALTRLMQTLDGGNKEMIMGILLEKLRFVLDRLQGPAQPINIADHIRLISLRYPEVSYRPFIYVYTVTNILFLI